MIVSQSQLSYKFSCAEVQYQGTKEACYFLRRNNVLVFMKSLLFAILLYSTAPVSAQQMTISGMMHHSTLEGGCWYLQADGGKRYELTGDAGVLNSLYEDGEHVSVLATPAKGAASICMMGDIVRVLRRIDTVRYPMDPVISPMMVEGTVHRTKSGVWYVKTAKGFQYEFKEPVLSKFRHIGMTVHERLRVLFQKDAENKNMNGVIISEAPKTTSPVDTASTARDKKFDPR